MKCPVDATPLEIVVRDGVEIDVCPECRGVWLDRGELQRLLIRFDAGWLERSSYAPLAFGQTRVLS